MAVAMPFHWLAQCHARWAGAELLTVQPALSSTTGCCSGRRPSKPCPEPAGAAAAHCLSPSCAQVRPRGQAAFGTKVEIKNMNSFSAMQRAIEFEIARQVG